MPANPGIRQILLEIVRELQLEIVDGLYSRSLIRMPYATGTFSRILTFKSLKIYLPYPVS